MKIIMTKGLVASGKTTWSRELVDKYPEKYKNICKDDLRLMLDNSKWSKTNEKFLLKVRDELIKQSINEGFNVIVSDTNFDPKHEIRLKELAQELGAEFEIKLFDVPVQECIRRDALREKPVGKKVIWDMYVRYIQPNEIIKEWVAEKPKAILVDMDGTLAHMSNRSPYDYSKVKDDYCDVFVKDIVWKYYDDGYDIIVVSGREDSCIDDTRDWLLKNDIPARKLFMRKTGDSRKDSIIKQEIYENEIKPNWSVFLCLDDRTQVVEMYRSLGLKVLQCNFGDF